MKLAKDTGVTVFRMGVDWCRIMPKEPTNGIKEAVSQEKIYKTLSLNQSVSRERVVINRT